MTNTSRLTTALLLLSLPGVAFGSTADRLYEFGDLPFEGAIDGQDLGVGLSAAATIDSASLFVGGNPDFSEPNVRSFANLSPVLPFLGGRPSYAVINDRPDLGPGEASFAASFNAAQRDVIYGPNLNFPQSSFSSVFSINDAGAGPFDYGGVSDRYLQFWVKPNNATDTQVLVMDTNEHGVRINNGVFAMRYAGADSDSTAAVEVGRPSDPDSNGWYHVMLLSQDNLFTQGKSILYVDGIAVAAVAGDYQISGQVDDPDAPGTPALIDDYPLSVGAGVRGYRSASNSLLFQVREPDYFDGMIDDLELAVIGFNRNDQWGLFDFATENRFASEIALAGIDIADVNLDGVVQGDGTGPAESDDVTTFVENFFTTKTLDAIVAGDEETIVPVVVGDLTTRARGDLNVDGIVDIRDWIILNAANPSMAGAVVEYLGVTTVPGAQRDLDRVGSLGNRGVPRPSPQAGVGNQPRAEMPGHRVPRRALPSRK